MIFATIAIFFALGLDTLAVGLGLGMGGLPRTRWMRVGLTFALFEGLIPALGLLIGHQMSGLLAHASGYVAGGLLLVLGGMEIKESYTEDDDDDDSLIKKVEGHKLLMAGLSVSLDELAIGFSMGVLKVSVGLALLYIGVQAFIVTFVGLFLGERIGNHLGEKAELLAGIVLVILGVGIIMQNAMGLHD